MLAPRAEQVEGSRRAGVPGTWGGVWHWLCDLGKFCTSLGSQTVICKGHLAPRGYGAMQWPLTYLRCLVFGGGGAPTHCCERRPRLTAMQCVPCPPPLTVHFPPSVVMSQKTGTGTAGA